MMCAVTIASQRLLRLLLDKMASFVQKIQTNGNNSGAQYDTTCSASKRKCGFFFDIRLFSNRVVLPRGELFQIFN